MKHPFLYLTVMTLVIAFTAAAMAQNEITPAAGGLTYQEIETGSGDTAEAGKIAVIHFSGWIDANGKQGDLIFNSRINDNPVAFKVGTDLVIKAWNLGVIGMKVGGRRRLMVPSHLGYGERGSGDAIPPNANLIFDIELIEVR